MFKVKNTYLNLISFLWFEKYVKNVFFKQYLISENDATSGICNFS